MYVRVYVCVRVRMCVGCVPSVVVPSMVHRKVLSVGLSTHTPLPRALFPFVLWFSSLPCGKGTGKGVRVRTRRCGPDLRHGERGSRGETVRGVSTGHPRGHDRRPPLLVLPPSDTSASRLSPGSSWRRLAFTVVSGQLLRPDHDTMSDRRERREGGGSGAPPTSITRSPEQPQQPTSSPSG